MVGSVPSKGQVSPTGQPSVATVIVEVWAFVRGWAGLDGAQNIYIMVPCLCEDFLATGGSWLSQGKPGGRGGSQRGAPACLFDLFPPSPGRTPPLSIAVGSQAWAAGPEPHLCCGADRCACKWPAVGRKVPLRLRSSSVS